MGLSNGRGDPDPELDPDPDRAGPEAQRAHGACARGSTGRTARPRFRQSPRRKSCDWPRGGREALPAAALKGQCPAKIG